MLREVGSGFSVVGGGGTSSINRFMDLWSEVLVLQGVTFLVFGISENS